MARSMWSGSINFGLVNIPIKLYSATTDKEIQFHMIHDADGSRVKIKRFCEKEDVEVEWANIQKGYELPNGKCIIITKEEIEALDPKSSTVAIEDFVSIEQIDPIYYDKTYYVMPDRGAANAYLLLMAAMGNSGKVGIGRIVLRTKSSLCCIRPMASGILGLSIMNYYDEVVPIEELKIGEPGQVNASELTMATRLVEELSTDFVPEHYKDERREKILRLIEQKAAGEKVVLLPAAKEVQVANLKDALEASLLASQKERRRKASAEDPHIRKTMERRKGAKK